MAIDPNILNAATGGAGTSPVNPNSGGGGGSGGSTVPLTDEEKAKQQAAADKARQQAQQQAKDASNMANPLVSDPNDPILGRMIYKTQNYRYDVNDIGLGNQYAQQYGGLGQAMQGRQAPGQFGGANINQQQSNQVRNQQMQLMNQLSQRAAGQGPPSIAEMQLKQGLDRNIAGARAMAASADGMNPALAQRQAQDAASQAGIATNQQAAMLRSQEQLQAQQELAGLTQGVRGQDLGVATQQAQLQQQAGLQGSQQQLQMQQMNDEMTRYYESLGFSKDQAALAAAQEVEKLRFSQAQNEMNLNAQMALARQQANLDVFKTGAQVASDQAAAAAQVAGSIGGAAMASDKNLKKDIKKAGSNIDEFMNALTAYTYNYKDEKYGKGRQTSVMAQDLETTDIGKQMVVNTPEGKIVDYGKGLGAMMAAIARLNERINEIEPDEDEEDDDEMEEDEDMDPRHGIMLMISKGRK